MSFNDRATFYKDSRWLASGKDTEIRNADGDLLCSVESFNAQVNFNNATWQALGSPIQIEHLTSYSVTIAIVEAIVEDTQFVEDMFEFFTNGRHAPDWTFSSIIKGYDGSESRYVFRHCVPSGQIDLHNFSVGDVIKRTWNLHCNHPPDLQKLLTMPE